jgi:hypothetical protein
MGELAKLTGTLLVRPSEPGAHVEIDGKARDKPDQPARLSIGPHAVKVTLAGFEPFTANVPISSEQDVVLDARLVAERAIGRLAVREQNGDPSEVLIDGEDKGPAPWEGDLPAGEHVVQIRGARHVSEPRRVTVAARQKFDLVLDATPTFAHLKVRATPASAVIKIDGQELATGVWEGDLPEGTHRLDVAAPGYDPIMRAVSLHQGESLVEEIPLAAGGIGQFHVSLTTAGLFPFHESSHADPPDDVEKGVHAAFGAFLRIGYQFPLLAIEVTAGVLIDRYADDVSGPSADPTITSQRVHLTYDSFGSFIGVGPRYTSRGSIVRFTAGFAPGFVTRSFTFSRNAFDTSCVGASCPGAAYSDRAGYGTLGLVGDLGAMFVVGSAVRVSVGAMGWIDFAPPDGLAVGPDRASLWRDDAFSKQPRGYFVARRVQAYLGPSLGVQYGN